MTEVLPVSHAEQLKSEKQTFDIILNKYQQCLEKYASTQNDNDKTSCNSYEKRLNKLIDIDMVLLQNNISKELNKMNLTMNQSIKDINTAKKKNMSFNKKKQNYVSETDLAASPHMYELFLVKIWRFIILAYYLLGISAIVYFFKKYGKSVGITDKLSNAIYNFRNMLTI